MKKWTMGLLIMLVLFSGCVKKTFEIDTRLGVKKDGNTGFFAYYTAASSKPVSSIKVYVASVDSILKPRVTLGDEKIYPIWVEDSNKVIVRPDDLTRILNAETELRDESISIVELGYFSTVVYFATGFPSHAFGEKEKAISEGLAWSSPKEELSEKIEKLFQECKQVAANYGADAIEDVVVFYGSSVGGHGQGYGVWLQAKAIVYVEE